jgi:hypothetical protein
MRDPDDAWIPYEMVDGRPIPVLPRGDRVADGYRFLTVKQLVMQHGRTPQHWRREWRSWYAVDVDPPRPPADGVRRFTMVGLTPVPVDPAGPMPRDRNVYTLDEIAKATRRMTPAALAALYNAFHPPVPTAGGKRKGATR